MAMMQRVRKEQGREWKGGNRSIQVCPTKHEGRGTLTRKAHHTQNECFFQQGTVLQTQGDQPCIIHAGNQPFPLSQAGCI
eukprot:1148453-Pelagomonas_calceolata.AAC.3